MLLHTGCCLPTILLENRCWLLKVFTVLTENENDAEVGGGCSVIGQLHWVLVVATRISPNRGRAYI